MEECCDTLSSGHDMAITLQSSQQLWLACTRSVPITGGGGPWETTPFHQELLQVNDNWGRGVTDFRGIATGYLPMFQ